KATAKQGVVDGVIKVDALDLDFAPLSEKDAKRLSDRAGVPIETAVALLQDKDGRIKLKLPVTGTIMEPEVDISSAVNKAIGSTLQKVFPPTLIGSMLTSVGEGAGGGVRFDPIKFAPGSAELDKAATKYMDELVALLQNQPKLSLKVCGRATIADLSAVSGTPVKPAAAPEAGKAKASTPEQAGAVTVPNALLEKHGPELRELAAERTRAVRRYFITDKGIESRRISECRVTFDAEDSGPPRVHVSL
ncbi:MAG: hypothetical protein JSW10_01405, partial [Pseudomonadota bacterium]